MECSQCEQELACTEDHATAVAEVEGLLTRPAIQVPNKLRLVLLYALRYERNPENRIARFTEMLGSSGATPEQQQLVGRTLSHYGSARRSGDLFGNKSTMTLMKKALQRSVKGVQNVYTQHTPALVAPLEAASKGLLSEASYPYLGSGAEQSVAQKKRAPTEVIVFVVGGCTYEEARAVGEMNASNPGVRILLGGTTVHNCDSFLQEVSKMPSAARPGGPGGAGVGGGGGAGRGGGGEWAPSGEQRKRISALTSSVTSTVSQGMSNISSKLQ